MIIDLNKRLARDGKADENDVRAIKKSLNRLGYYMPHPQTGINGIPDAGMFRGLKAFQKDNGIPATGIVRPDDETVRKLNDENEQDQEGQYIWRTVGDGSVRPHHSVLEGTVQEKGVYPEPGDEHNCRCWAENISDKEIEKEILPPYQAETPRIPGTDIPDRGIPEQGYPGSRKYDPFLPDPNDNDPIERKPHDSGRTPVYEQSPQLPEDIEI